MGLDFPFITLAVFFLLILLQVKHAHDMEDLLSKIIEAKAEIDSLKFKSTQLQSELNFLKRSIAFQNSRVSSEPLEVPKKHLKLVK